MGDEERRCFRNVFVPRCGVRMRMVYKKIEREKDTHKITGIELFGSGGADACI